MVVDIWAYLNYIANDPYDEDCKQVQVVDSCLIQTLWFGMVVICTFDNIAEILEALFSVTENLKFR